MLVLCSILLFWATAYLAVDLHWEGRQEVLRQFSAFQALLARHAAQEVGAVLQDSSTDLRALAACVAANHEDRSWFEQELQRCAANLDPSWVPILTVLDERGAVLHTTGGDDARLSQDTADLVSWARKPDSPTQVLVTWGTDSRRGGLSPASGLRLELATPLRQPGFASAVPSSAGGANGVLLISLDLASALRQQLKPLSPHFESQRIWIMDEDGTILLHSEHPEMTRENIHRVGPQCAQCHESFDYAQRMLVQKAGITDYRLKGQPLKVAAYAPMRFANASWIVVVAAPYAEVTAFAGRNFTRTLFLLALMAAALSLAAAAFNQSNLEKVKAEEDARQWQEKHLLEEQIRLAEERYRTVFRHSPDGILLIDPRTTLPIDFNEAAHRQLGYSRDEFARLGLSDCEANATLEDARVRVDDLLRNGWEHYETKHRTKDGRLRDVEVITQTLELGGRKVFHCIHHDITERKRVEQVLEHRTAQLEALHQVNLGITAETEPGILLRTILTRAVGLFRGTAGGLFLHRPERGLLELVIETGHSSTVTGSALRKGEELAGKVWESGEPLVVADYACWEGRRPGPEACVCASAMGAPIRWGDQFVGVLELCSDSPGFFTAADANLMGLFATQAAIALKNAGLLAQVRRDAEIQATLLNDVNHRVKNNLLRLIEIVRLERKHAPTTEAGLRAALADFEDRLRGMEVVHTMLSTTRWNPLPLNELVTQIVLAALSGSPIRDRIRVSFVAPTDPLQVIPEQATAVALILNELATNSVKYAFRDRDGGSLEVWLQAESARGTRPLIRLKYRDDGPGWPEEVLRDQAGAVGLHLIQSSVRSPLRGNLSLRNEGGAVAELAFRLALPG